MKSTAYLLGLLIWCLGQSAFGQSAVVHEDQPPYPGLGSQFTRTTLSQGEREAFEQRAAQKLQDLVDYLALAGSASYDAQLRKKAMGMCLDLFHSEAETFAMILPDCRKPGLGPIGEYLQLLVKSRQYETLAVSLSEVHLVTPATAQEDGSYKGSLAFSIDAAFKNNAITKCARSYEGTISFYLVRIPKKFGAKEKMVWETKLGGAI